MATLASRITDLAAAIRDKLNLMTSQFKPTGLTVAFDGGGSVLAAGMFVDIMVPFGSSIQSWSIYADPSGSIQFDIYRVTHANFPPNSGNTITASAKPAISSTSKGTSAVLTGWSTTLADSDVLRVRIDSASAVTKASLTLKLTRTSNAAQP